MNINITVDSYTGFIYFDSSDFKEGEEMYFKIRADKYAYIDYYSDGIYYDFINNIDLLFIIKVNQNM